MAMKIAQESLEPHAQELDEVCFGLGDILRTACAREPVARYPQAAAMATALREIRENLRADRDLPVRTTLPPRTRRRRVLALRQARAGAFNYTYRYTTTTGDPDARHDPDARYLFPFAHGTKQKLGQGYDGAVSHQGVHAYALDFTMARGTPVHAARGPDLAQELHRGEPHPELLLVQALRE